MKFNKKTVQQWKSKNKLNISREKKNDEKIQQIECGNQNTEQSV